MRISEDTVPVLDDQLCFDLYVASQAVTEAYRPALGRLGLNYPQYLVLLALWEHGALPVAELADLLQMGDSDLNLVLLRMTGNRHVAKGAAADGTVTVTSTELADALRPDITAIHCEMKAMLGMDASEFRALQHTLRTVTRIARAMR